jgi:hypothetical protein
MSSQQDFRQVVCRADALGDDVFTAPDHLGGLAPFTALSAAGMISERLRLRTYVLNTGFWNPALPAHEVATLDVLSQGRAELGLGAALSVAARPAEIARLRQVKGDPAGPSPCAPQLRRPREWTRCTGRPTAALTELPTPRSRPPEGRYGCLCTF